MHSHVAQAWGVVFIVFVTSSYAALECRFETDTVLSYGLNCSSIYVAPSVNVTFFNPSSALYVFSLCASEEIRIEGLLFFRGVGISVMTAPRIIIDAGGNVSFVRLEVYATELFIIDGGAFDGHGRVCNLEMQQLALPGPQGACQAVGGTCGGQGGFHYSAGGDGTSNTGYDGPAAQTYDDPTNPLLPGTPGNLGYIGSPNAPAFLTIPGCGGGAISIMADHLIVNTSAEVGAVIVSGTLGYYGGSGAGGSVKVRVKSWCVTSDASNPATFYATGASSTDDEGGGGAGGLIYAIYDDSIKPHCYPPTGLVSGGGVNGRKGGDGSCSMTTQQTYPGLQLSCPAAEYYCEYGYSSQSCTTSTGFDPSSSSTATGHTTSSGTSTTTSTDASTSTTSSNGSAGGSGGSASAGSTTQGATSSTTASAIASSSSATTTTTTASTDGTSSTSTTSSDATASASSATTQDPAALKAATGTATSPSGGSSSMTYIIVAVVAILVVGVILVGLILYRRSRARSPRRKYRAASGGKDCHNNKLEMSDTSSPTKSGSVPGSPTRSETPGDSSPKAPVPSMNPVFVYPEPMPEPQEAHMTGHSVSSLNGGSITESSTSPTVAESWPAKPQALRTSMLGVLNPNAAAASAQNPSEARVSIQLGSRAGTPPPRSATPPPLLGPMPAFHSPADEKTMTVAFTTFAPPPPATPPPSDEATAHTESTTYDHGSEATLHFPTLVPPPPASAASLLPPLPRTSSNPNQPPPVNFGANDNRLQLPQRGVASSLPQHLRPPQQGAGNDERRMQVSLGSASTAAPIHRDSVASSAAPTLIGSFNHSQRSRGLSSADSMRLLAMQSEAKIIFFTEEQTLQVNLQAVEEVNIAAIEGGDFPSRNTDVMEDLQTPEPANLNKPRPTSLPYYHHNVEQDHTPVLRPTSLAQLDAAQSPDPEPRRRAVTYNKNATNNNGDANKKEDPALRKRATSYNQGAADDEEEGNKPRRVKSMAYNERPEPAVRAATGARPVSLGYDGGRNAERDQTPKARPVSLANAAPQGMESTQSDTSDAKTEHYSLKRKGGRSEQLREMLQAPTTSKLGSGLTADVYAVTYNKARVAVKKFKQGDEGALVEFHAEVAALGRVAMRGHPHVLAMAFICVEPDMHAIVVELAEGGSLAACVSGALPLTNRARRAAVAGVASGMAFLHLSGVVHLDLKPGNVLRTRTGIVKIADFGTSVVLNIDQDDRVTTGDFLGTPRYSAPERFTPGRQINLKPTDVYSFGLTMWAVYAQQPPPGDGDDITALLAARLNSRGLQAHLPLVWAGDDLPTYELILRCCDPDPRARPTFDSIVAKFATPY